MNTLKSISIFIGLIAFLPLWYEMLLKDKRQSFLSMIFWGSLDLLFGISAFISTPKGSYELPFWYAGGGFLTALIALLKNRQIDFEKDEKRILFVSVISFLVFGLATFNLLGKNSLNISGYSSIISIAIASYFMLKDAWKFPKDFPTPYIYGLFTIADILNVLSGKDSSLFEIGFGITYAIVCGLVVLFSMNLLQKRFLKK
ncbi:MAG: hypothetical protein KBD12_01005 [Candidatus Pacebacteria bacterium]|nr:hypothetical protein [Candidatus Paceibacterota bacterium]